tara:strand:- start:4051 stop:4335 length:285 start_codon:yes stop_codon:yes gene_type:complete
MSDEKQFIDGMLVKPPHERAPDFVKCSGGFRRLAMIEYLQNQTGDYVNFDIKESRNGKWYAELNTYKPETAKRPDVGQSSPPQDASTFDDDIPF